MHKPFYGIKYRHTLLHNIYMNMMEFSSGRINYVISQFHPIIIWYIHSLPFGTYMLMCAIYIHTFYFYNNNNSFTYNRDKYICVGIHLYNLLRLCCLLKDCVLVRRSVKNDFIELF